MADLLTLAEYKAFQGINPSNTSNDPQLTVLLPAASRAVREYVGRNFEVTTGVATTRTFPLSGEMLDIDDAVTVTSVASDGGLVGQSFPLTSDQWVAMPQDDSDVFYYLLILGGPYLGFSPEMGFRSNLDQYPMVATRSPLITVTATWGWPAIPEDVKLAASLTVSELLQSTRTGEGIAAESIEGWARSYVASRLDSGQLTIPTHARDILDNYRKISI